METLLDVDSTQQARKTPGLGARLRRRFLSVSILIKTMSIGTTVALVFAGVMFILTRSSVTEVVEQRLTDRACSEAHLLGAFIERQASGFETREGLTLQLRRTREAFPDYAYLILRDREGRIAAHTFDDKIPHHIQPRLAPQNFQECKLRVINGQKPRVFETVTPLYNGPQTALLQLGLQDTMAAQEVSALSEDLIWGLAICFAVASLLALPLSKLLTHPLQSLTEVTHRIREGDFGARARVYSDDEVGQLAVAFNEMASSLQHSHRQIEEKERERQALIERLVGVQEEERRALSRELHDHVGQSLLAIMMSLNSECRQDCQTGTNFVDLDKRLRSLVDDVHHLAWGMRPSILDDFGLQEALERHLEDVGRRNGLEIDFDYCAPEDAGRLPSAVEVTLFRIGQEALANTVRHAGARQASVVVLQSSREVLLMIEDDGQGFDPEAVDQRRLGLAGMRERVAQHRGSLQIRSDGQGTSLRIQIPLHQEGTTCPSPSPSQTITPCSAVGCAPCSRPATS